MPQLFSNQQRNYLDKAFSLGGFAILLGTIIESLNTAILGSSLAIQSDPSDVDDVCLDAKAFGWDVDGTSGLNFAWRAGLFSIGLTNVNVAAGTIGLTASITNYIEADKTGIVYTNTSGFTPGRFSMFTVLTGSSSISANNVTPVKALYSIIPLAGVTGNMLSTIAATKTVSFKVGAVAATTTVNLPLPNFAGTISDIRISSQASISASDADKYAITCLNLGTSGSGSTNVLNATAATNSTAATGGSAITANVQRALALSGTGANLNTNARDLLQMVITKTGAPASLTDFTVEVDLQIAG